MAVGGRIGAEPRAQARAPKPTRKTAEAARWTSKAECRLRASAREGNGEGDGAGLVWPPDTRRQPEEEEECGIRLREATIELRRHRGGHLGFGFARWRTGRGGYGKGTTAMGET